MTEPTDVEPSPLTIPASMDASDADEFREFTRVRNKVYREIAGTDDDDLTPEELLPHYQPSPEEIRYVWVAVVDGEIVGRVSVDLPLEEGSRAAFWLIELLRAHQGRGIGTAGYRLIEEKAREHGRTVLQSWTRHPDAPGPRLEPPTGFGSGSPKTGPRGSTCETATPSSRSSARARWIWRHPPPTSRASSPLPRRRRRATASCSGSCRHPRSTSPRTPG